MIEINRLNAEVDELFKARGQRIIAKQNYQKAKTAIGKTIVQYLKQNKGKQFPINLFAKATSMPACQIWNILNEVGEVSFNKVKKTIKYIPSQNIDICEGEEAIYRTVNRTYVQYSENIKNDNDDWNEDDGYFINGKLRKKISRYIYK